MCSSECAALHPLKPECSIIAKDKPKKMRLNAQGKCYLTIGKCQTAEGGLNNDIDVIIYSLQTFKL